MANLTAKTSSNIFYKARCEAATHNEQLSSREGAADYSSLSFLPLSWMQCSVISAPILLSVFLLL